MTTPLRIRAPKNDGGLLAVPGLAEAPALLRRNSQRLAGWDYDFQGRSASSLRDLLRVEAHRRAAIHHDRFGLERPASAEPDSPWVVTGHQPELFHPGVWIKNFAVGAIRGQVGGVGLNLIVDNDVAKSASIRVPTGPGGALHVRPVAFDDRAGDSPFEDLRVHSEADYAAFPDRVRETLGDLVADPIIDLLRAGLADAARRTDRLGLRFSLARRRIEADWGVRNLELPLSSLCETDGFLWFTAHLIAHLPRFQAVHNDALIGYRRAHGIRSRHHPVPALGAEGDWLEAPFWAWRSERPRRRPLLARSRDRFIDLRIAGEDQTLIELPLAPDREGCCAVERLRELPGMGVRLRTRALTTTMFSRLLLADLFLHGIGGAKYDELGDEIVRGFFGFEPPAFQTLSLTAWPGLPVPATTADDLRRLGRDLRDLEFNPDRHLDGSQDAEVAEGIAAKQSALALPVETHRQRAARTRAIRASNHRLIPFVVDQAEAIRSEQSTLAEKLRVGAIARSREFSMAVHSADRLQSTFAEVLKSPGRSVNP